MTAWEAIGLVIGGLFVYACIGCFLTKHGATPFLAQRTSGNRARLKQASSLKEIDYCTPLIHGGPSDHELAASTSRVMVKSLEKCAFQGDVNGVKKVHREWTWRMRGNKAIGFDDITSTCKHYMTKARSVRGLEPEPIKYSDEINWDDDGTWRQS